MEMDRQRQCAFACAIVGVNSFHMFNANELEEGKSISGLGCGNLRCVHYVNQFHIGKV